MAQFPFQDWTDSSASMHCIIGGGKGKSYVLAKQKRKKRLIHKNIKNEERTVIVKCFVKDTVCH